MVGEVVVEREKFVDDPVTCSLCSEIGRGQIDSQRKLNEDLNFFAFISNDLGYIFPKTFPVNPK